MKREHCNFALRPIELRSLAAMALSLLLCPAVCRLAAQTPPAAPPPAPAQPRLASSPTPEQLAMRAAAEKDHQRLMEMLGIKELRPGASHDPASPNAVNYDESKANVYPTLPDPLLLKNGKRMNSAKLWWTKRRPEIVEAFDSEILGRVPANLPKVTWEVTGTKTETIGGIPAVTKRLTGRVDNSAWPQITVAIDMTLTTPAHAAGPVPVIMELAFSEEFMTTVAQKSIPEMLPGGPGNTGPPWQQQVLERGWGFAILSPTCFQADNGAGLTAGIIGLVNKGQPRKLDDWGTLRAWAWGASRAMDYFETDKDVDAKQVGLEGHSRFGKTALVTMAYDPRFAVGYISSSGTGGAKLYRHVFGEQLENLAATGEYHWLDGNFLKYAGPLTPGDLPVDSHELIALVAPRPVFIGVGTTSGDGWADARGMFLAEMGAGPVYRLLGKKDLGTAEFPTIETALTDGDLGFRQHTFGHTPAPNWPTFLEFASRYLHAPAAKTP